MIPSSGDDIIVNRVSQMSAFASCEFVNLPVFFLAPTIHKFAKSQLRTDSQNLEKLASCRLCTKPLVGFSLGVLDPLSPLMIERPSCPCHFSDTETIEIAATAWLNLSPEDGGVWYGILGEVRGDVSWVQWQDWWQRWQCSGGSVYSY
jgi:hypothetical protein